MRTPPSILPHLILPLLAATSLFAIDRKPVAEVDVNAMTEETQIIVSPEPEHMTFLWWIPHEFWAVSMMADPSQDAGTTQQVLDSLKGYAVLGVVQADIDDLGNFDFYPEAKVVSTLKVSYENAKGEKTTVAPSKNRSAELNNLLLTMRPVLAGAMGNMGQNLHLIVFDDVTANGSRLVDVYEEGQLQIEIQNNQSDVMEVSLALPLDCLYIPRKCPNGRDAHVTWKFCPWSGEKLPE